MGTCVQSEVATGGWDHLERVGDVSGPQGIIVNPVAFSGFGGRDKEKSNGSRKWRRGTGEKEKNKASAAGSVRCKVRCTKTDTYLASAQTRRILIENSVVVHHFICYAYATT